MDRTILISVASMSGLGLFFASVLAVANQKLKVKEDPRVKAIRDILPGVNCGACGFASCHMYSEALAEGKVAPELCRAGGDEVRTKLSEILGVTVEEKVKELAIVHCGAPEGKRKKKALYAGIKNCVAADSTMGGEIVCAFGCLGYADCRAACPFDAIDMIDGLPIIDKEKCTACGKCVSACPRKIIAIEKVETEKFLYVACNNSEKGAEARKGCPAACIACGICGKLSGGIFSVEGNLARVNHGKSRDLKAPDVIVEKCPTKCISELK